MRKFYEVIFNIGDLPVSVVRCKSLNQVAYICNETDFSLINIEVVTPKNKILSGLDIKELWNA